MKLSGSNTFFEEDVTWDCVDAGPYHYGKSNNLNAAPVSPIAWQGMVNTTNPFEKSVGPGFVGSTCQFPQITREGLIDSHQHGVDLASVYGGVLGFLPLEYDSDLVSFRVTNNVSKIHPFLFLSTFLHESSLFSFIRFL